jgi:hypothetical protein
VSPFPTCDQLVPSKEYVLNSGEPENPHANATLEELSLARPTLLLAVNPDMDKLLPTCDQLLPLYLYVLNSVEPDWLFLKKAISEESRATRLNKKELAILNPLPVRDHEPELREYALREKVGLSKKAIRVDDKDDITDSLVPVIAN